MAGSSLSNFLTPLHIPSSSVAGAPSPVAQVQQVLEKQRGEEWIWGQDDVGLYQGTDKLPQHQLLSVQLTTHRLLFLLTPSTSNPSVPSSSSSSSRPSPLSHNLQVQLQDVRQTEFYTGFMRSSPKISLFLGRAHDREAMANGGSDRDPTSTDLVPISSGNVNLQPGDHAAQSDGSWTCHICSYTNLPGPSNARERDTKCSLCGIAKVTSMSLPVSRSSTPLSGVRSGLGGKADEGGAGRSKLGSTGGQVDGRRSSMEVGRTVTAHATRGELGGSSSTDVSANKALEGSSRKEIPCPRCTFLNHPSLRQCEICSAPLHLASISTQPITKPNGSNNLARDAPSPGRPPRASPSRTYDLIKISFRKGGSPEMYKRLKAVLERKAWEAGGGQGRSGGGSSGNAEGIAGPEDGAEYGRKGIGIDRILQDIDLESKTKEDDVQDAFKDLEALMVRAGDMVRLVQTLSTKLEQSPTSDQDSAESTFIRSSLVQLGLPVPALTQDMVKSKEAYHLGLAKELGAFLTGGVDERGKRLEGVMVGRSGKGLVGLDEVWGLWNRARGVSLVPPKALDAVLPFLASNTRPQVSVMTFQSGLSVLHTPVYSSQAFANRLLRKLQPDENSGPQDPITLAEKSLSAVDIALQEGVAVGLAKELVEKIELESGLIVRDEQSVEGGGEKWQRNLISLWLWQDPN